MLEPAKHLRHTYARILGADLVGSNLRMKSYIWFLNALKHYYRHEIAVFECIRDNGFFQDQYDRLVKGERGADISDACLCVWTDFAFTGNAEPVFIDNDPSFVY